MNDNPYDPPTTASSISNGQTNWTGVAGFVCSISGLAGMAGGLILTAKFGVSLVFQALIAISLSAQKRDAHMINMRCHANSSRKKR